MNTARHVAKMLAVVGMLAFIISFAVSMWATRPT